ncbi:MAG: NAD(P)H-quinone oxidoreductase [Rothia sp. (in: high G+C Gram-positive bacteria)]|nr:NAD(P)H-quinone oxidoreductase [Rothia sp. (in: high G+C Gram-positive bacteria)]
MKAVLEDHHGGPEVLRLSEVDAPQPGAGQILLGVHAAGLNRADVLQRHGKYPVPAGESNIYGLEVSGTVEQVGDGVDPALMGQERVALLGSGGYAEYVAVDVSHTLPKPKNLSHAEAAGLMEVAATVYSNLIGAAGLSTELSENQGKTALVHGGTGGIGLHAIALLKNLGVKVFTTAGAPEKCAYLQSIGAEAINYRHQNFREVLSAEAPGGVDYILDVVGGKYFEDNLRSLAVDGHLCFIALQGGTQAQADLALMMNRRLNVHGTTLRGRPANQKAAIVRGVGKVVWPLVERGLIQPHLDRVFDFAQVQEAHEYFDSGEHRGKVVLSMR